MVFKVCSTALSANQGCPGAQLHMESTLCYHTEIWRRTATKWHTASNQACHKAYQHDHVIHRPIRLAFGAAGC
jgi:hypothetical protein